ncbi:DUF551 domain-containing protein [Klebsiella pneumoniae]
MDSESGYLPLDYLQGHKDGLEWAAQLAEANHPETGDWLYDDPIELAKAIRKGPDMQPAQPVEDSEPDRNPVLAYADSYRDMAKQGVESVPIWSVITDIERNIAPLYRHAQPAPVVDADDNFYSWFGREWAENYQHNQYTTAAKQMLGVMAESAWKAGRRAAMLAAAPQSPGSDPATVPGKWIPVSEQMPEKNQNVLISVNFDSDLVEPLICSARYTGSTFRRGDVTVKPGTGIEEATHWMPLPAAPQEVSDA